MTPINGDRDELAGAFVWSTLNQRDPELSSPYGDNNPPVKSPEDIAVEAYRKVYGDTPKTWGEMTDEEKGALLLAKHEGKVIERKYSVNYDWISDFTHVFYDYYAYRIKPEPNRETLTIYRSGNYWTKDTSPKQSDTHRITFDLIDGDPDTSSIRMEKI